MYHRVQLGALFGACLGVDVRMYLMFFGAYLECTWECPESLLCCVYQVCWECVIEINRQCIWECAQENASEHLESLLASIWSSRLWGCHRVQLGASWVSAWEYTWEHTWRWTWERTSSLLETVLRAYVTQAGSVQSSAIRSVLQSVFGRV